MKEEKMILPRNGFQSSVNLNYDLGRDEKVRDFVPTEATLRVIEELVLATSPHATERAHILVGAYGKGKSHAVLVLLSLLAKRHVSALQPTLDALESYRSELGQYIRTQVLAEDAAPFLPVIVDGRQQHLAQAFLRALQRTLTEAQLETLLPETPYQSAVKQIYRWQEDFPATCQALATNIDMPLNAFIKRLEAFDHECYQKFLAVYPELTAGSRFEPYADADVVELYAAAAQAVRAHGYRGLYVVYDEFGKYLEAQMETAEMGEMRLLQDFAERAGRSSEAQLHLLLITHKDITNYLGHITKAKIDGWRGVAERFVHVEMQESFAEAYELMGRVIEKDAAHFAAFSRIHATEFATLEARTQSLHVLADARDEVETVRACYPLHPLTVYLLPRLADLVAQNERTLFTFLARDSRDTLCAFLRQADWQAQNMPLLRPDMVFDYFEPLFRQEAYTSLIGIAYRRCLQALAKTQDSLSCSLLKTISLLEMVTQGVGVLPTADVLVYAYDGAAGSRQVLHAVHVLAGRLFLLHKRPANGAFSIKAASGVDVQQRCMDAAEKLRTEQPLVEVMNRLVKDVYLYPSQYNDDYEMTRYFACRFLTGTGLLAQMDWEQYVTSTGADGLICILLLETVEQYHQLASKLTDGSMQAERCLFLLPKRSHDISRAAYEYLAATRLAQQEEDQVLHDEYVIVRTDSRERLMSFLRDVLEPERGGIDCYYAGQRQHVQRRAQLSRVLSDICTHAFAETPIINNETLNRNTLTAASQRTRDRVVNALLEPVLQPDLGQKGNSQGMAFVRSALLHTGILVQSDGKLEIQRQGLADTRMERVLSIIDDFFARADGGEGSSFARLYERLRAPQYHIAMKRGPLPILLAATLRPYRAYMTVIGPDGQEMQICADLFRAIEAHPDQYRVQREDWSVEKEAYVQALHELFASSTRRKGTTCTEFSDLTNSMQHWCMSLPNYTRRTATVNDLSKRFCKSLQKPYLNAHEYLFRKLPKLIGRESLATVAADVGAAKQELDMAKEKLVSRLAHELIMVFGEAVRRETSLGSALADWRESLPAAAKEHVFSGEVQACFNVILTPPAATKDIVETLGRMVIGLRLDDWDDAKVELFMARIRAIKREIDAYATELQETGRGESEVMQEDYLLKYIDETGQVKQKSFGRVTAGPRAKLLRNEIDEALETMGSALSREEKRQVLVEVLQAMF